ncbi:PucR family transcriptional regulator ligand-binding domain-containing protein [Haloechinothrix sp. LS1_15]|uniref:PucR family transcriptional regulator n=1 Tax=Haloechinothrix sp. LS1_15 TaxID=2652248 RepID=UPI00294B5110|nr:helix-turn-helix domain-containing protein [Haloechinothrix sp. LS1_15]
MKLRELLADTELRLERLVGTEEALEREFRSVMSTDLPDPSRYLTGGELVLTGMVWRRAPEDSRSFVAALCESGVAALAAGDQFHPVPDDLVDACEAADLPLLRVPADIAFGTLITRVSRVLGPQRADEVATLLGQHRDLADPDAEAADWLAEVLRLVHSRLELGCAVLGPTGRVVARAGLDLDERHREELARTYLSGRHLPAAVDGHTVYGTGSAFASRVLGCFLVFAEDCARWGGDRYHMAAELAALVATGWRRMLRARQERRPLVEEIVQRVCSGADPAGLRPRLEVAGLPVDASLMVVVARLRGGERSGSDELARGMLEELLQREAAVYAGEAVALVPVAAEGVPDEDRQQRGDHPAALVSRLRQEASGLACGLGTERLLLGTSGVVAGESGLRGAIDEARHACRLSELRAGQAVLTGHEDLASHMMLLAAVPDDVRQSFRERVLGPVLAYDEAHGGSLVPTLRAFLDSSGSWTKCARELHLHVNTLRYRIQRIEQLTGRDLGRIDDRVDFYLAFSLT